MSAKEQNKPRNMRERNSFFMCMTSELEDINTDEKKLHYVFIFVGR